jgi:hypothetical protein
MGSAKLYLMIFDTPGHARGCKDNSHNLRRDKLTAFDLGTSKHALGTSKHQLGTSKHQLGTSKHALGTTKYDLGTSKFDLGTSKHALGTSKHDNGTSKYALGTSKHQLGTSKMSSQSAARLANDRAILDILNATVNFRALNFGQRQQAMKHHQLRKTVVRALHDSL